MSNTPETEKVKAALHTNWHDLLNHARKLERERDEARDKYATEATDHMLAVNKLCNERDEAQADCLEQARLLGMGSEREARLISERDEAVEEIKEWETLCLWGGTPEHIHGFIGGQQTRIWHLECERDEARDNIEGWENKWRCAVDMAARAELERDDAWEDAKLLSERLTALELQSTAELARLEQELINMKELHESNN
jgi:hypothetical protein